MSINNMNQSNNTEPLPGTLQQRIENAQNHLEEMEAEVRRLEKYISVEKGKIDAFHAEKKSLQSNINSLNTDLEDMTKEIATRKKELETLLYQIADSKHELKELKAESDQINAKNLEKSTELTNRETMIAKQEESIRERINLLTNKEVAHQLKIEKLQEALK